MDIQSLYLWGGIVSNAGSSFVTLWQPPQPPPLDNGVTPLTETGAAQRKCGKKRQTVSKLAKKAVRVGEIIAISQVNNVNCGERSPHQKYHLQRKFLLTVDLCSFLNLWTWCFPNFETPNYRSCSKPQYLPGFPCYPQLLSEGSWRAEIVAGLLRSQKCNQRSWKSSQFIFTMICSKCLAPNGETWKPPHILQKEVKADLAKKMQYNPKQFCNLKTYFIAIFAHDMYRLCT